MKALAEIFADGSIVDNTVHQSDQGQFLRDGRLFETFLQSGHKLNNPGRAWGFLCGSATLDVTQGTVIARGPEYEHNTEGGLFELHGQSWESFTLTTGNLIGCVTDGDYSLKVSSRFGDDFLKFIIADADGFKELPDLGGESRGGYEWLLVYLWLIKLKKAYRLGLPKAYDTRNEVLTTVRGRLDPIDFVLNSERGRYRCTYREHSYDNGATRLIAQTLRHLDGHAFLQDAHALNQTFQTATRGVRHPLGELLDTKPVRNPYYSDYNEVLSLSKRILRNELADFGAASKTSAFFFDVSMLFEYFVRKLLMRAGARFGEKNGAKWKIPTGTKTRELIPDLVFEVDGRTFVFDVKYKRFDFRDGVQREDLFQLHTYVAHLANEADVAGCGFIYPVRESTWTRQNLGPRNGMLVSRISQHQRAVPFIVAFVPVPDESGEQSPEEWRESFPTRFRSNCQEFTRNLLNKLEAPFGVSRSTFVA